MRFNIQLLLLALYLHSTSSTPAGVSDQQEPKIFLHNQADTKWGEAAVPFHRYWNSKIRDHFYQSWRTPEGDKNLEGLGFVYQGVVGSVFRNPVTGTVPIHRYWGGAIGDHFYTTNWGEVKGGDANYKYEGIEGYAYPSPTNGTVPLYRYWSQGAKDHFYTTNWNEINAEKNGYKIQGIQAYVLK